MSSAEILKQLQFPVAVFACLQAGSVFYLAIYFDFIKEKYKIDDEIFDWFDFMLNAFALFGILPGLLLKYLSPKKTAILGGILIVLGQMMTALMVSSEHAKIKDNSTVMLGAITIMAGQGSCLVLFSCLQALMNVQTIQASHVISTCCISYYLGSDSFILSIKEGLFADTTFTSFTMALGIAAFVLTVLNAIIITDEEDAGGFFGKAQALTKGIIYKKTDYMHLVILLVYSSILLYFSMEDGGMSDSLSAIVLLTLVLMNLFVPVSLIFLLDAERIRSMVGEPSEIEKKLSNKGVDHSFSDAALRIDFWYLAITSMVVIGGSRMYDENAEDLGLHNEKKTAMIEQTYGVFEVLGATIMGSLLTFFRSKIQPTLCIVFCVLIAMLGQIAMIYPKEFTSWDPMWIAVATASFAEGGLLVSLSSYTHEEYGTESFGLLLGTMTTFGAVGLYAMDEVFFPNIFSWYATENAAGVTYFKSYGEWNVFLFTSMAGGYFLCLILAIISHISVSRRENASSEKLVMVKF